MRSPVRNGPQSVEPTMDGPSHCTRRGWPQASVAKFSERRLRGEMFFPNAIDANAGHRSGLCGGSRGRHEFEAFNLRRDAHAPVAGGLNAHDLAEATDIYVIRLRHLLGKSDHKFDFATDRKFGFREEIQAAVTDVPGLRGQFGSMRFVRKHAERQRHIKTPGFAAVG